MSKHNIRRSDRAISDTEARAILEVVEWGVLSTTGADGLPYGVPISYALVGETLYFHAAHQGRKIDNLTHQTQASFCVVGPTQPVYTDNFTTYYESVIVTGPVRTVTDTDEKTNALRVLVMKYLPDHADKADYHIERSFKRTRVLAMDITTMTGKAKRRAADDPITCKNR